jgi:DNA-binding LytR/AlgR family response regulator
MDLKSCVPAAGPSWCIFTPVRRCIFAPALTGAFDFVTKPVDLDDLETTIRKTLAEIARVREIDRLRAAAERARSNLSRYFSPNIVGMLASQDEPLGAVRRQDVAALFVDIVSASPGWQSRCSPKWWSPYCASFTSE